jgi:Tfp pilus assembly pilus retraction ATPase PilT
MRQDPDVIAIGEILDADAMWAALSAASTGHLVMTTLPTTRVG